MMWNRDYEELRAESAAALGRARTLLATAQDLSAQAQGADVKLPEYATLGTARAVADATRLVIRSSARCAALTVLESEAAQARARATIRSAMDVCAHSSRLRAERRGATPANAALSTDVAAPRLRLVND